MQQNRVDCNEPPNDSTHDASNLYVSFVPPSMPLMRTRSSYSSFPERASSAHIVCLGCTTIGDVHLQTARPHHWQSSCVIQLMVSVALPPVIWVMTTPLYLARCVPLYRPWLTCGFVSQVTLSAQRLATGLSKSRKVFEHDKVCSKSSVML